MKNVNLTIPYGKRHLKFSLPEKRLIGVLEKKKGRVVDMRRLLSGSLDNTSSENRLEKLVADKKHILIIVPDATRSAHLKELLPCLLAKIRNKTRSIDIIVATGSHKKHDDGQLKRLLGNAVIKKCKVISHEQREGALINLGRTRDGVPITLNKNLTQYDFMISVGVIEPHLYAGYSGGAKTAAIGLAGEDTINATHSIRFLDDPLTGLGSIADNPFQKTLWEIISKISIGFAVNIVNDGNGRAIKIFAGDIESVFKKGSSFLKKMFDIYAKKAADVVICGVGYPKDINLYQASRAINYVVNVDRPVLRKGGVLIVAAELIDGAGTSAAEFRFYETLKNMGSPKGFVANVRRNGCIVGEHRAYMVAKALLDYNIIFVNTSCREFMKGLPFPCFSDLEMALLHADRILGKESKIYVIPRALSAIARMRPA